MKVLHRYNTRDRQHYLLDKHYTFHLKPRLLYSGYLCKSDDWHEKEHSHEFAEIIFILDGRGAVYVNGVGHSLKKGDLVIYNAGVTHYETSDPKEPLEAQFVAFDKFEITDLEPNCFLPPHYDFLYHTEDMYDDFRKYFNTIIEETINKKQFYAEIAQNASHTLIMYLFRMLNRTEGTNELLHRNEALMRAMRYIDAHFSEDISLDVIAEQCYINKYHLSHLFAKYEGTTVGKYILAKRLDEAKRLLHFNELSVMEISQQSGFNDLSYFCRAFKKEVGSTPRQYRKSLKNAL